MGHDQEAIRRAKSQGIFDDQFDPLVLGLPDEEKHRLHRDLGEARRDMEAEAGRSANGARPNAEAGRPAGPAKKPAKKRGLLERFLRFLVMLFTGVQGADYEKQQLLKQIRKDLKSVKPAIYNFRSDSISAEIARQLFFLFQNLIPFKRTFDAIFKTPDAGSQLEFQSYFLRIASKNPRIHELDAFTRQAITEWAESEREPILRKQLETRLQDFLGSFDVEEKRRLEKIFVEMIAFRELLDYDFAAFFKRFCPGFNPHDAAVSPDFIDARPEGFLRNLKDLETILLAVNLRYLPRVLETARNYFAQVLLPEMEAADGQAVLALMDQAAAGNFQQVIGAVNRMLESGKLTLLIRFLESNPDYEAHVYQRKANFFAEFAKGLVASVEKRIAAIYKQKSQETIAQQMEQLFGVRHFPMPYVYSDKTNEHLEKLELPRFNYVQPLGFCLHFLKDKFFPHYKRSINRLLVDGNFKNSMTRRMISEEFYRMDELFGHFNAFLGTVDEKQEKGAMLGNMIRNYRGDLPSKKALSARLTEIDQTVYPILRQMRLSIQSFQIAFTQVHDDLNAQNPEVIDNLRKVAGANNARFLGEFRAMQHEIDLASDIYSQIFKEAV